MDTDRGASFKCSKWLEDHCFIPAAELCDIYQALLSATPRSQIQALERDSNVRRT